MIERVKNLVRRPLVRNILALYGVRVVDQLLPLLLIPYLARVLGPAGWGLVAFAQAFAIYGIVTVEYGFEYAGTRAVAQGRQQPGRLAELVAGVLGTQLLLACALTLVAVVIQLLVPAFRDQPLLLWAGLAFAVLQGVAPIWYFTGQERLALIAGIDTGAKLLGTVAVLLLVRGPADGWLVLAASAGASLVSTSIAYALVLRETRPGRLSLRLIGHTLRLGASMFLMRLSVLMHTAGNAFLLGLLVAPQQVAFFVAGEKLCRPAAWLLQPINVALLPRLSHLVGHSPDRAKALAGLSILLMALVGLGFGVALGIAAPWLIGLFFGPEYGVAVAVMRVMALIVPLIVLNAALVSQWLIPHGLDRQLNFVILSASALNLALALGLVPRFGALGMAWGPWPSRATSCSACGGRCSATGSGRSSPACCARLGLGRSRTTPVLSGQRERRPSVPATKASSSRASAAGSRARWCAASAAPSVGRSASARVVASASCSRLANTAPTAAGALSCRRIMEKPAPSSRIRAEHVRGRKHQKPSRKRLAIGSSPCCRRRSKIIPAVGERASRDRSRTNSGGRRIARPHPPGRVGLDLDDARRDSAPVLGEPSPHVMLGLAIAGKAHFGLALVGRIRLRRQGGHRSSPDGSRRLIRGAVDDFT